MKTQKSTAIMGIFAILAILGLLTGCPDKPKDDPPALAVSVEVVVEGLNVSWNALQDANSFDVIRRVGSTGSGSAIATSLSASTLSYTDTSGTANTAYSYQVVAKIGTDEMRSGWSTEETFPDLSTQIPSVPTNIVATADSATEITIGWDAVADAIGYRVYQDTSSSGTFTTLVSGAALVTTVTYAVTGLTPSTTYYFKVIAVNSVGNSAMSGAASATTLQLPEIDWSSSGEWDGILSIDNKTEFDMVLFSDIPSLTSVIGGAKSQTEVTKDISDKVSNFQTGGPMVLRAMKHSEYLTNINDLSKGRIEYTAFTAYGQGKKYRAILTSTWDGKYSYLVENRLSNRGIELRKDAKNGEMVSYLATAQSPTSLYATSQSNITLYPVFVAYNPQSKSLVYYESSAWKDTPIEVAPRSNPTDVYQFPPSDVDADTMFEDIEFPYATIIVQHNATRDANFRVGAVAQTGQSKYPQIQAGAGETYDIAGGTGDGTEVALNFSLQANTVQVPVRFAGESSNPKIKNGFIYRTVLTLTGTNVDDPSHYTAVITEIGAIDPSGFIISQ